MEVWDQRWQNPTTGRQTKLFFPTVMDRQNVDKDSIFGHKLTQFMTNHATFNSYLARFHIKDQDYCDYCIGEEDDANHRLFRCKKYDIPRNRFKQIIETKGYSWLPTHIALAKELINDFTEYCEKII